MTTATISPVPRQAAPRRNGLRWLIADVAVMTRRVLARIAREPETLMDVTVQPLMFVLLFAYVFGGAIAIPGGGNYHEYLIGGMLGMGLAQTAPGVAVALVSTVFWNSNVGRRMSTRVGSSSPATSGFAWPLT